MCRLLGALSSWECGLPYWLVDGKNALREQSRKHPHGWGIAAFSGGAWKLVREPKPAHQDERFVHEARAARGWAFVAHVRNASRGGLTLANTHPFLRHGWAFAHNGTVVNDAELRADIAPDMPPLGETDSEALFLLILTELRRASPAYPAVPSAEVCRCLLDVVPRINANRGTSFLLSDGRRLFFYRERMSLMWLRLEDDAMDGLLIASEPIGEERWTDIPDGEGFVAEASLHMPAWSELAGTSS
jgi:glutamine amidotransferase